MPAEAGIQKRPPDKVDASLRWHDSAGSKGFSTIELVLTIGILGLLALTLAPGMDSAVDSYNLFATRRQSITDIRAGLERMSREIRQLPSTSEINIKTSNRFKFELPVGTDIDYQLSGNNITRNSDILMSGISTLSFGYFDGNETSVGNAASFRYVQIEITTTAGVSFRAQVALINASGSYYTGFTQS